MSEKQKIIDLIEVNKIEQLEAEKSLKETLEWLDFYNDDSHINDVKKNNYQIKVNKLKSKIYFLNRQQQKLFASLNKQQGYESKKELIKFSMDANKQRQKDKVNAQKEIQKIIHENQEKKLEITLAKIKLNEIANEKKLKLKDSEIEFIKLCRQIKGKIIRNEITELKEILKIIDNKFNELELN